MSHNLGRDVPGSEKLYARFHFVPYSWARLRKCRHKITILHVDREGREL